MISIQCGAFWLSYDNILYGFLYVQPAAPYSSSVTSVRGNASLSTLAPAKQQQVSIKHEPDII